MTTNAIRRAEGSSPWARDVNRLASGWLGQEPASAYLLKQDKSGNYVTLEEAGIVFDAPVSFGGPVDFDGDIEIDGGHQIVLWNAGDTNSANLKHSGTDDILKTDDGLWVAGALGVGITPSGHATGDLIASGDLKFRSGTAFTVGFDHAATADRVWTFQDATGVVVGRATTDDLSGKTFTDDLVWKSGTASTITLDHTATANRVWTFQDASDTVVGRATTDTLTNKTLTTPTINDATISGTWSGSPTFSGVLTSSNVVRLADGSAATPALGFTSAAGDGLYWVSSGRLGVTLSGAKVMEVVNSGATVGVGIGMAPSVALDVQRFSADYVSRIEQTNNAASSRVLYLKTASASATDTILTLDSGATNRLHVYASGGVTVGSGAANQGAGTINVTGNIYKNAVAYVNPHGGFERAYTGRLERFGDRMAAMGLPDYRPLSLDALEAYTRQHFHFPYFGDDEHLGLFDGGERLLLVVEELATHLFGLHHRVRALEDA